MRALCFICLLFGCTGSPDDAPVVAGGGYRGTFAGSVTITVHDQTDESPIGGAVVTVDGIEVGATAADGSIVVDGETADRIEVSASGYATMAYVGTGAEVVTVAMRRPSATFGNVAGSVSGLDGFEVPAGAVLRTRVGVAAEGERIALRAPVATCEGIGACFFEGTAMPGVPTRFFAQIEAVDDMGTPGIADDVVTPLSFALSDTVMASGLSADTVDLEPLPSSELAALEIELPGSVPGIDRVVGVPGVGLGSAILFFGAHDGQTEFLLPAAMGEFEGSRRWAVTHASRDDGAESVAVVRAAQGEAVASLVAPVPGAIPELSSAGGELDLSTVGTRALVEVWEASEARWTLVFDDRDTLALSGPADVTIWNAPPQTDGFRLSELRSTFTGWVAVPVAP